MRSASTGRRSSPPRGATPSGGSRCRATSIRAPCLRRPRRSARRSHACSRATDAGRGMSSIWGTASSRGSSPTTSRRWSRPSPSSRPPTTVDGKDGTGRFSMISIRGGAATMMLLAIASCGRAPEAPPAAAATPDLAGYDIARLQQGMQDGTLDSRRITQWSLNRIAALDDAGPTLNAVIAINPDALAIADERDAERRAGKLRGPLHGIPVLLKDNIDTGDKQLTTAGSLALTGAPAPRDAEVARRLREAGAVILGKANLSEWANIRSTHSTSGWSAVGGQTRNPYVLDRNPCGSSSGSGVAVSAGMVVAAIGTETDGSIVCPASVNGVVGFKPTVGLVSRHGIVPIAHSQDTAGPMTRSVADAAIVLDAIAGSDAADQATHEANARRTDFRAALEGATLSGRRIGVVREHGGGGEESKAILDAAVATLKARGAEVVDPVALPHASDDSGDELTVLLFELREDLGAYLSERGTPTRKSLADVIAFNEREAAVGQAWFGQGQVLQP